MLSFVAKNAPRRGVVRPRDIATLAREGFRGSQRVSLPTALKGQRRLYSLFDHLPTNNTEPTTPRPAEDRSKSERRRSVFDVAQQPKKKVTRDALSVQEATAEKASKEGERRSVFDILQGNKMTEVVAQQEPNVATQSQANIKESQSSSQTEMTQEAQTQPTKPSIFYVSAQKATAEQRSKEGDRQSVFEPTVTAQNQITKEMQSSSQVEMIQEVHTQSTKPSIFYASAQKATAEHGTKERHSLFDVFEPEKKLAQQKEPDTTTHQTRTNAQKIESSSQVGMIQEVQDPEREMSQQKDLEETTQTQINASETQASVGVENIEEAQIPAPPVIQADATTSLVDALHLRDEEEGSKATRDTLFDTLHSKDETDPDLESRVTDKERHTPLGILQQQVLDLRQIAAKLSPISLFAQGESNTHQDANEREELFRRTKNLMTNFEQAVQQGKIDPAGKHGRSVSAALGDIMSFYSACHHHHQDTASPSPFEECRRVLLCLDQWNLERQEPHYQYAILAAGNEQLWQEASDLFMQQIDREVSGFCPVKVSVSSPVGLYVIARATQEKGITAVEPVLDAVTSLTLISPTEKDQHVLAVGTALGLAGEWEGLLSYLETSINASSLGQALVAATMHACLLCNQHDVALQVYRTLLDGHLAISSEFHWGGGEHQILPLCRDLAMRASANTILDGHSSQAMDLLRETLQGELTISAEALEGVLSACERDKNWKDAVDVLFRCINPDSNIRIVPGSSLHIPTIGDLAESNNLEMDGALVDRGRMVSLAMRACNASSKFGTALLCHILTDTAPPGSVLYAAGHPHVAGGELGPIEQTLLPLIAEVENTELLSAATVALCGLSCFEEARGLFDVTKERLGDSSDFSDAWSIQQYVDAYADSSTEHGVWNSAHRHIYRLCTALETIRTEGDILDRDQLRALSAAYASALRSCTVAKQAEVGILLGEHIQSTLSRLAASLSENRSLFGRPTQASSDYGLILTDTLLAEKLKALRATKQADVAISLFESAVEGETFTQWSQSCNAAISILIQNEQEKKAEMLIQNLVKSTDNVESFAAAGNAFARAERWDDVADVYHMALEKGCLSTELGIMGMKAVAEMTMLGKLRVLRGMIQETGRSVGQSPVDWLDSNYWRVKKQLGIRHAHLLMWWNDPNTSHLDELQYALEVFEKRLADGLQAKVVTLRLIVTHARHFREGDFPTEKKEIVRVPRDRQSWVTLLERVLQESHNLKNDVYFIDEYSMALRNLGCNLECVKFVREAMERGITVRQNALREALAAADAAGIQDDAGDIKLALFAF